MKYEKSCGTITYKDNKVLLIKQISGFWGFPKGHIENNESEVETAYRETLEETAIHTSINEKYRYEISFIAYENIDKHVVYFLAHPINTDFKRQEEEIDCVKWVNFEDAFDLLSFDDTKDVWIQALNDIKNLEK